MFIKQVFSYFLYQNYCGAFPTFTMDMKKAVFLIFQTGLQKSP